MSRRARYIRGTRRLTLLLLALVSITAATTVVARPASAMVACPPGVLCTYDGWGYGGSMYFYSAFETCYPVGGFGISAAINNKSIPARLYYGSNCAGNWADLRLPGNAGEPYILPPLNNHVWSIKISFNV